MAFVRTSGCGRSPGTWKDRKMMCDGQLGRVIRKRWMIRWVGGGGVVTRGRAAGEEKPVHSAARRWWCWRVFVYG